jgi:hypothetical protein
MRKQSKGIGEWVAAVSLVALGLFAVFFPAGAYGQQSFYGLLSLPVGITVLMGLLIERWWPLVGRRVRRSLSR